jgi:hypothetical protein
MQHDAQYFRIPGKVLLDPTLKPLSRLLYGVILKYSFNGKAKADGYCWAQDKHLAEQMGVTPKTISRAVQELIDHQHLGVEFTRTKKTRRLYPQTDVTEPWTHLSLVHPQVL